MATLHRRLLVALAAVPILFFVAHWTFRAVVSRAIAFAPNGGGVGAAPASTAPPPGAITVSVSVDSPPATLSTWIMEPRDAPAHGTVVLLHGIRSNRSSMLGFARRFRDAGYRCVLPDLRGHGASTGTYLTYGETEARDVAQVLDRALQDERTSPVFAFGYSYGGAVALRLAEADPRVRAVATVATFASLRQVVADYRHRYFPALDTSLPGSWTDAAVQDAAAMVHFDPDHTPASAAARAGRPLLLVHGLADTQVPPQHANMLRDAAGSAAKLILIEHGTHVSVLQDDGGEVGNAALAFFQRS